MGQRQSCPKVSGVYKMKKDNNINIKEESINQHPRNFHVSKCSIAFYQKIGQNFNCRFVSAWENLEQTLQKSYFGSF